jgi:hypothetical protein
MCFLLYGWTFSNIFWHHVLTTGFPFVITIIGPFDTRSIINIPSVNVDGESISFSWEAKSCQWIQHESWTWCPVHQSDHCDSFFMCVLYRNGSIGNEWYAEKICYEGGRLYKWESPFDLHFEYQFDCLYVEMIYEEIRNNTVVWNHFNHGLTFFPVSCSYCMYFTQLLHTVCGAPSSVDGKPKKHYFFQWPFGRWTDSTI